MRAVFSPGGRRETYKTQEVDNIYSLGLFLTFKAKGVSNAIQAMTAGERTFWWRC